MVQKEQEHASRLLKETMFDPRHLVELSVDSSLFCLTHTIIFANSFPLRPQFHNF